VCREKRQVKHSALKEPRFRRYYPASWCSGLGSWMLRFLLGWNAWALTQSALWVGIVSALMLAPALLLSPYFGVQSDRVNPRHGLIWSMLIHGAIATCGALATYFGMLNLAVLLILATALGSVSAMHSPMRLALVPMLVPREALPSAVGLTAMSFNIARILGPAICAAVIASAGVVWAWMIPVFIFATSGVILNSLGGVGTRQKRTHGSINSEFVDGLRYVLSMASLVTILALTSVNGFLGRSFIELLPAVSGRLIAGGPAELAWLTAAAGSGAVLGGLIMSRLKADVSYLFNMSVAAMFFAACLLSNLGWIAQLPSLFILVGLLSLSTTLAGTACQTLAQLIIDPQYHGRVMSLWSMTMMAAPALGAAVHGAIAEWLGFVIAFALAAVVGVLGLAGLYARRRGMADAEPVASVTTNDSR
jgi:MFS family permease